jgi:hypothetical protein
MSIPSRIDTIINGILIIKDPSALEEAIIEERLLLEKENLEAGTLLIGPSWLDKDNSDQAAFDMMADQWIPLFHYEGITAYLVYDFVTLNTGDFLLIPKGK